METGSLHHVEIGTTDGEAVVGLFKTKYGFRFTAQRSCSYCKQWVLEAGKAVILVTEATSKFHLEENDVENVSYNDPLFNVWSNPENNRFYDENTVFNVALKVTDIQQVVNNVIEGGGVVVTPPTSIKDEHGEIDIAVVKSCIGNVYHTLLSYHKYSGLSLIHI